MELWNYHVGAIQALELTQVGVHFALQPHGVDWRAVGLEDRLHDVSELAEALHVNRKIAVVLAGRGGRDKVIDPRQQGDAF